MFQHIGPRSALLALLTLMASAAVASGDDDMPTDDTDPYPWMGYLFYAGRELGYQFTIEVLRTSDEDEFYVKTVPANRDHGQEFVTMEKTLEKLSQKLPEVAFIRNKQRPRVIHAIDKRLLKMKDYIVDKKIDLNFKGVIGDISRKLNETYPAIGPRTEGLIGEVFDDYVTEVDIVAKDKRIRNVLTDATPSKSYDWILWRCWTKKQAGQWYTEVQFYGPRRDRQGR